MIRFIERDMNGKIKGDYALQQDYAEEMIDSESPEFITWRQSLIPVVLDQSDLNNIPKQIKAIMLAAATLSGKTPAQAKQAYLQAWGSLS